MSIKSIFKILFLLGIMFLFYRLIFWPEKELKYPAGILIKEDPYQRNLTNVKSWYREEYKIIPLAEFHLRARVLSLEWYHMDKESDLAPVDFALGWGPMSDQANLNKIEISQRNRWYHWTSNRLPIPRTLVETKSANMHMVPADDNVEEELDKVIKGDLIELKGYLIQIQSNDSWTWKSSLTRYDTGGGACEVVWVEDFKIIKPYLGLN